MIYSCSMFFNEFKLLNLKIAEQADYVDKIIIVDSEKTHSNKKKKPLLFNSDYNHPKLLKILAKESEFTKNVSYNESFQRDITLRDIDIKDEDIIISCDLDEIIPAKNMEETINQIKEFHYVRLGMKLYYYKINMLMGSWRSPIGLTGKYYKESGKTLTQLRHAREGKVINTLGKHFSYLTDAKGIKYKLESFLHCKQHGKIDIKDIDKKMKKGINLFKDKECKIVPIDESYPDTILNNLKEWKEWIA